MKHRKCLCSVHSFRRLFAAFLALSLLAMLSISATAQDKQSAADKLFEEAKALRQKRTVESMRKAIDKFEAALKLYREDNNRNGEALSLSYIGWDYYLLGELQKALEYYEQALTLKREIGDRSGEAKTLSTICGIYSILGEMQKALEYYQQALTLNREIGDRSGEARTLQGIGWVYSDLGERQKALEYYHQTLMLNREIGDRSAEAAALHGIGRVYSDLGEMQKALEYYEQALTLNRAVGNRRGGEANTLSIIGGVYSILDEKQKALDYYQQALTLNREIGDRSGEARMLQSIGSVYSDLGEKQKALEYYQQALMLSRAVGDSGEEASTLGKLMTFWKDMGRSRIAIVFGKKSVNLHQKTRSVFNELWGRSAQRRFLKSVESSYRELAELLIKIGRIGEAEQVLEMLKEEEYFEFIRRDEKVAAALKKRINLTEAEAKAIAEYERLGDRLTTIGSELAKLDEQRLKLPETAAFPQQARYDELKTQLAAAIKAFEVFQRQLAEEFSKENVRVREIESGLQASLQSWGMPGTVIIYTIAGKDQLYVIVTTTKAQEPHIVEIKAEELNKLVAEFRSAIANPTIDPRPVGKKLYDLLVKPIEADLKGAGAKTLLWSLDGALRYVPIAALWDGKQYLAERFDNVMIALASRDKVAVTPQPVRNWRGLGLGVSQPWHEFPALPAVPEELKSIIRQEPSSEQERGVLPGRRLLDQDFTRAALERALGRYSVIHVASHFSFQPGREKSSFLLLGDGAPYPLEVVSTSTPMFTGVELLTLSACNTAIGGDADGKEVEGFGMLAQKQGALSVIATLWAVADVSTGMLMQEFYRLRTAKPEITKAEALRMAQLALLRGELKGSDGKKTEPRTSKIAGAAAQGQASFKSDPNAPYAHPYYWAPFILIGNWR